MTSEYLAETEQRHEQSRDLKSDQLKSCHELVLGHATYKVVVTSFYVITT